MTTISIDMVTSADIVYYMEESGLTTAKYFGRFPNPADPGNCNKNIDVYEVDGCMVVSTNGGTIWDNGNPDFDEIIKEYQINL